jgi:ABC-type multidrug transport system fused ATPase/permease subunit
VTAWEALRRGAWPEADLGETLAAIREFLLGEAPEETPAVLWERFQAFIRMSTDDEFLEFIRVCEWSTRNIPAVDAAPALQQRLVEIGHAADESSAEALYFRLFAYVFRRLALPGLKRLTSEDLHAQAEAVRSGADPEDRQTLETVRMLLTTLQGRVSALEAMMVEARAESSTALARIDDLARERGIRAAVAHMAAVPITSEPPLVDRLTARSSTVEDVLAECGACTSIALHGTSGSGKSQLALLIARHLSGTRPWIRFRDLSLPEAVLRFDAALAALAASRLEDITSLLHEFLRTIG